MKPYLYILLFSSILLFNKCKDHDYPPLLNVSEVELNFGETEDKMTFFISNDGGTDLTYEIIFDNSEWLKFDNKIDNLIPSETNLIKAEIIREEMESKDYSATAFVKSNGGNHTIEIKVSNGLPEPETFTDIRDANVYKIVTINNQTWMAENLRYNSTGSCYYNFNNADQEYGRLYSWETASSSCPDGWHLPSKSEFEILIEYLGGQDVAGGKIQDTTHWDYIQDCVTNESGFSILPGGYYEGGYYEDYAIFLHLTGMAYFWTSTSLQTDEVSVLLMTGGCSAFILSFYLDPYFDEYPDKMSIRCIKTTKK